MLDAAQCEPVAIQRHGRAVAVMLSAEDYEALEAMKLAALRAKVRRGLADVAAGRVADADAVFGELDALLDRAEI